MEVYLSGIQGALHEVGELCCPGHKQCYLSLYLGSRHQPVNRIRMAHKWLSSSPPAQKKQRHSFNVTKHVRFPLRVYSCIYI